MKLRLRSITDNHIGIDACVPSLFQHLTGWSYDESCWALSKLNGKRRRNEYFYDTEIHKALKKLGAKFERRSFGLRISVAEFAKQYARPGVLYFMSCEEHVCLLRDGKIIENRAPVWDSWHSNRCWRMPVDCVYKLNKLPDPALVKKHKRQQHSTPVTTLFVTWDDV